jgi:hypothetical protein
MEIGKYTCMAHNAVAAGVVTRRSRRFAELSPRASGGAAKLA